MLVDRGRRSFVSTLFDHLGRLVSLLNDWHDLGSDIRGLRANAFVLAQEARGHALPYAWKAFFRLLGARGSHESMAEMLCEALEDVLRAAEAVGPETSRKTQALLHHLVPSS
jgi:hypothetical protein